MRPTCLSFLFVTHTTKTITVSVWPNGPLYFFILAYYNCDIKDNRNHPSTLYNQRVPTEYNICLKPTTTKKGCLPKAFSES